MQVFDWPPLKPPMKIAIPSPPLLPSLRRHRRLRRPPSANRCHLIGLIELKIRWRWDFATILIVLIKFKWPANWRGWGTWQICSTPVQRRVLWRKSCSFFLPLLLLLLLLLRLLSVLNLDSIHSPFDYQSNSIAASIDGLTFAATGAIFELIWSREHLDGLCYADFHGFMLLIYVGGGEGVGAIVCDSPMVPHLQSLSVRWLTHFNRIYYYHFLKNDVNYCLISNV